MTALTYLERYALAQDPDFLHRVMMAELAVAAEVSREGSYVPFHEQRYAAARAVMQNPVPFSTQLALISVAHGDADVESSDADLSANMLANWNGIAGIASVAQMAVLTDAAETVTVAALMCIDSLSLHSTNPGGDGLTGELDGGDPAYARQACTWGTPVPSLLPLGANVTWDVPAATVIYIGMWDGSVYMGCFLIRPETFSGQDTFTLHAADMTLIC